MILEASNQDLTAVAGTSLVNGVCNLGCDNGLTDFEAEILEEFSVLCSLDGLTGGTEKLGTALTKDTLLLSLHSKV